MPIYNDVLLIQTLYLVSFARYSASKISVSDLDLSGSPKVKYFYFIGKPICHIIMVFCGYELSISYRLRDIPHLRFRLVTSTFQGSKVKYFYFIKKPMCHFIIVFCWYELYLVLFARYPACKISVSDLDFSGSSKIKYFCFIRKPICHFIMAFWFELFISYRLRDIPHLRFRLVTLTFQGHRGSIISPFLGSRYGSFSLPSVDTNSLSRTFCQIFRI